MLQLTHVTLKTRQVILQDVDFTFEKGRIYGILAINGSGKKLTICSGKMKRRIMNLYQMTRTLTLN